MDRVQLQSSVMVSIPSNSDPGVAHWLSPICNARVEFVKQSYWLEYHDEPQRNNFLDYPKGAVQRGASEESNTGI